MALELPQRVHKPKLITRSTGRTRMQSILSS